MDSTLSVMSDISNLISSVVLSECWWESELMLAAHIDSDVLFSRFDAVLWIIVLPQSW